MTLLSKLLKEQTQSIETLKKENINLLTDLSSLVQGSTTSIFQRFDQVSVESGRNAAEMLEMMRQIRRQLDSVSGTKPTDSLSEQLENCIDRLYDLKDLGKEDFDIESPEAHSIAEDFVTILKALLEEVNLPDSSKADCKRKSGIGEEQGAADTPNAIKRRRMLTKMSGIVDSSHKVQVRRSSKWPYVYLESGWLTIYRLANTKCSIWTTHRVR